MKKDTYGQVIAEPGDVVSVGSIYATIDRILYQEYWRGWDIEFIDTCGHYRHWKQGFDGGELLPKKEKRYYNGYGIDCTDIFAKYGYC